ncbi:MAG: hypothetical protein EOQ52_20365 [Mesorhizobium sp.]|uniref:hypothetical protein n=1 Tax=Mesorhizobium sp. TaxID=1871066 RepID=UPI000FE5CA40|nr:hypothetical protein [Mesorhizobium sp.]RWB85908.1 MAG: hypothetical protein EOQ52_20365 [Mesorhizobium sp.]
MAFATSNITVGSTRGVGRISLSNLFGDASGGDSVLKRALSKVKPDEGGEAHFRFGKASSFSLVDPTTQRTSPSVSYNWPDDGNQDDEPKEFHIIEYDEVSRCWETIRVENPDDPEQYVMVRNTLRVVFVGRDDGLYRAFNLAKADAYK